VAEMKYLPAGGRLNAACLDHILETNEREYIDFVVK